MTRIIKEKTEIIERVLRQYFSRKNRESSRCRLFNPNLMAAYIKKEMDGPRLREYERHLFRCPFCGRVYKDIENGIETLFSARIREIGKPLLEKALETIREEQKKYTEQKGRSGIFIRLKEKGMEMTGLFNFRKFRPVLMPALRQGHENALLREISVENGRGPESYVLRLFHEDRQSFNLELETAGGPSKGPEGGKTELISSGARLSRPAAKTVIFEKVPRGSYTLLYRDKELCRIEAE